MNEYGQEDMDSEIESLEHMISLLTEFDKETVIKILQRQVDKLKERKQQLDAEAGQGDWVQKLGTRAEGEPMAQEEKEAWHGLLGAMAEGKGE